MSESPEVTPPPAAEAHDPLQEARDLAAFNYDQLLRLKAEFENYRKRVEREKHDHRRWGKEDVLLKLLGLLDVVDHAEASLATAADTKALAQGMAMFFSEFRRFLNDEGLGAVDAKVGDPFSPDIHEAVAWVEDGGTENRITAVVQRGYKMGGNLLRPARVQVSRKPAAPPQPA